MFDISRLVTRFKQGDLAAFASLFDHFQDRLFDIAWTILRDREEAKDAVQETFLTMFQKIEGYRGEAAFETWLIAICVNECRGRLRRQKLRRWLLLEPLFGSKQGEENPAAVVGRQLQREALWAMVDTLDDRLRIPLLLRYRYGMGCGEIAVALGLATSTVYEQLSEGRKLLRQMRQKQEPSRAAGWGREAC